MIDHGLEPGFSPAVEQPLASITSPAREAGATRILVAIADVGALVDKGTPVDDHARARNASPWSPRWSSTPARS